MRIPHWPIVLLGASLACSSGDGLDTKLSTELQHARIVVLVGPPSADTTMPKAGAKSDSKCALRLRDANTGTVYQLAQSTKRQPDGPPSDPAGWPEFGDYSVHVNGRGQGAAAESGSTVPHCNPLVSCPPDPDGSWRFSHALCRRHRSRGSRGA